MLPHSPCLFLTLVRTQGQEDKARCVGRSLGDPHTAGVWSSICQEGHSSCQVPGLGESSVLNESESSPGFSLPSSGLGMGSRDGYLGR